MLDEELRAALADWVRPVASLPAPDIRVLRRRIRRRGIRRALTAAVITAAVAAAAIGITVNLPGLSRSPARTPSPAAPQAPSGTWYPGRWFPARSLPAPDADPAAAPYVVGIGGDPGLAVVTDAFSGRTLGTIDPYPGESLAGVAAAGDDRTFLFAAQAETSVNFYEERLSPAGRPESLVLVFALPGPTVPRFAVSPDARLLAYTTSGGIRVISLATGTGRSWTASGGRAVSLSWASDGTLAFEWLPAASAARAQVRLLDTTAPGTGLLASRPLVPSCANPYGYVCVPLSPLITPDGSKVFAAFLFNGNGDLVTQVEEFSARTGRVLVAVKPAVSWQGGNTICQVLWTDPGGSQATAFCGRAGVIAGGRFSPATLHLPSGALSGSDQSFAW